MKKLAILFVMIIYLVGCAISQHYTAHGTVVETDADCVTIAFPSGNEFSFYAESEGDYTVGDKISVRMNTNGTDDTVLDDYVEKVTIKEEAR